MRWRAQLKAPRININAYRSQVKKEFEQHVRNAAKLWLNATVVAIIPVWSGASRATFLHLARAVSFSLSVAPASRAPNRVGLGQRSGSGGIETDLIRGRFYFNYGTTLNYLIFNEYNDANAALGLSLKRPGPYNFQIAGQQAFLRYASQVRLPDVRKFMRVRQILV